MIAKKIILVANTAWNLWNYRLSLIRALTQAGYSVVLLAPDDPFRSALQEETAARFIPLRHLSRKSLSPVSNFRFFLELARIFRQECPAAIMLYTIKANIVGNFAASAAGVSAISVVEGLGYSGSAAARWRWLAAPLYRLALRKARKVIFLNRDDCQEFLDNQLVNDRQAQIIHGPGIDLTRFQPRENPPDLPIVFLFSGRLLSEKGIREFAAAARLLKSEKAPAEFHILGAPDDGNPTSISPEEVNAWVKEGFLHFSGSVADVRPALAAAHVLVLPSFYREGVPRSVLEAMAMGKIIITSDTPGCRDTVDEGLNGFLVAPRDVPALANAMRRVLQLTPGQKQLLQEHSLQKVRAEFSDDLVLPQYLTLIKTVLSAPKAQHIAPLPPAPQSDL